MKKLYTIAIGLLFLQSVSALAMERLANAAVDAKAVDAKKENNEREVVLSLYQNGDEHSGEATFSDNSEKAKKARDKEIDDMVDSLMCIKYGDNHALHDAKPLLRDKIKDYIKLAQANGVVADSSSKENINILKEMHSARLSARSTPISKENPTQTLSSSSNGSIKLPDELEKLAEDAVKEFVKSEWFQKWLARGLAFIGTVAGAGISALATHYLGGGSSSASPMSNCTNS